MLHSALPDGHCLCYDVEYKQLEAERKANKLSQEQFQAALKTLGRKHYLTVRWLSLFDTIDSIMSQFPIYKASGVEQS
jgi:hypothetical protein